MKKALHLLAIISILISCTNVMDKKVSTKEYENYKKVLFSIDTLDAIEKEYIIEQSKKMIIAKGILEKEYSDIGLQVDTSEFPTFGEFYNWKSKFWREKNSSQKAIMERNIIIDSEILILDFLEVNTSLNQIIDYECTNRIVKYFRYSYNWEYNYDINIDGIVHVTHNIKNLNSFLPDYDLSQYGSPTFRKVNDSTFEFKTKISSTGYIFYSNIFDSDPTNMSKSDLEYYCKNDYLPYSIIEKHCVPAIEKRAYCHLNEEALHVKIKKLSTNDYSPKGVLMPDVKFLSQEEVNERNSIYDEGIDSITIKK